MKLWLRWIWFCILVGPGEISWAQYKQADWNHHNFVGPYRSAYTEMKEELRLMSVRHAQDWDRIQTDLDRITARAEALREGITKHSE
jgi:hypothetical protein